MKYLYMNEQERQIQYYQFPKFLLELMLSQNARKRIYDRILERCIPVKINGVSRREAITKDNMQTMKNILKS